MQQDADFITADFLHMFRASCPHHQEYKILTRQPTVQVVMVASRSSLRHIIKHRRDATRCRFYYCRLSLHVSGAMRHVRDETVFRP